MKKNSPLITHIGDRSSPQRRNSFLPSIAKEKQIKQIFNKAYQILFWFLSRGGWF